jgi:hypothetical protein
VKPTTMLISLWRWCAPEDADRVTGLSVTSEAFAVARPEQMRLKSRVLVDESGALRDNERAALLSRRVK